jgi:DNA repair exonuclease SbcCD ATPase subunit
VKIVKLEAENVKRLHAVEITPDGDVVVIAGRNGAGKSSVLDAIWMALGGAAAAKSTPRPIRDGADKARVSLDLGDLRVTRTWVGEKTTLLVENADGARYSTPQAILDRLVGKLSFDPLAFAQQDPRTQRATLLELVGFDPSELDADRAAAYDERTAVGREVRTLEAQLGAMAEPAPEDVGAAEVSSTDVLQDYYAAQDVVRRREDASRNLDATRVGLADAEESLRIAQARYADAQAAHERAKVRVQELPEAPDLDTFRERLATLEATNTRIRAAHEYGNVLRRRDDVRARYEALTAEIARIDEEKQSAIRGAAMPITGLGFDADGVTFRGVPFSQCSSAERLRVSLAMAMALNPTLRVVRITDGSLLDSANMALIAEMAADNDFQCWIERVDESGDVGVVIEDGHVAATDDSH